MYAWQMFVCIAGAGRVVGWREAERRSCADLRKQAGPADGRPGLWNRRGPQSAHHSGSHVANPVLLCPHWWGDSGERTSWAFPFFAFVLTYSLLLTPLLFLLNSLSGGHELGVQERQLQEKIASLLVFYYSGGKQQQQHTHIHWYTLHPPEP